MIDRRDGLGMPRLSSIPGAALADAALVVLRTGGPMEAPAGRLKLHPLMVGDHASPLHLEERRLAPFHWPRGRHRHRHQRPPTADCVRSRSAE